MDTYLSRDSSFGSHVSWILIKEQEMIISDRAMKQERPKLTNGWNNHINVTKYTVTLICTFLYGSQNDTYLVYNNLFTWCKPWERKYIIINNIRLLTLAINIYIFSVREATQKLPGRVKLFTLGKKRWLVKTSSHSLLRLTLFYLKKTISYRFRKRFSTRF